MRRGRWRVRGRDRVQADDARLPHQQLARGEAEERDCERSRADGHSLGLPFPRTVVPAQKVQSTIP